MSCECTFNGGQLERICLVHLRWLQLIDTARPILEELMDCDQQIRDWLARAKDLPRSSSFPLAVQALKSK